MSAGLGLRGVLVSAELIAEVFADGWTNARPGALRRITVLGGLPAGAKLYTIRWAPNGEWMFVFEHPSFALVSGAIPPIDPGGVPLMRPQVDTEWLETVAGSPCS